MYLEEEQVSLFGQDLWSGKMSLERSAAENRKEQISQQSLKRSSKSQSREPLCLCVYRTEDGTNPGAITLKMVPGALLGEYTTHSFGESPSEENVSRLSQILEASPHQKYCLSAKACQGILNRAERRGKELPDALKAALMAQSVSRNEPENLGGGKGILIQPERTGALSTLNNQSVLCLNDQGGSVMSASVDVSGCLRAQEHGHQPIVAGVSAGQGEKAGGIGWREEQAPMINAEQQSAVFAFQQNASGEVRQSPVGYTISTNSNPSGRNSPLCYDARGNGDGETVCTLTGDHKNRVTDYTALCVGNGQMQNITMKEIGNTLDTMHDQQCVMVADLDCRNGRENGDLCGTLQSKPNGDFSYNCIHPVRCANTVRRLTPLECERLQGYPDGWTDIGEWVDTKGKKHKEADSPRYKALGNSIALPFWCWLARRISAQYERDITMGSLFDGIGGFPYAFEKCGGKAVWASEIEEFPIAVTKLRFGDET